jgi:adenine-specific DNA-methyltransferase
MNAQTKQYRSTARSATHRPLENCIYAMNTRERTNMNLDRFYFAPDSVLRASGQAFGFMEEDGEADQFRAPFPSAQDDMAKRQSTAGEHGSPRAVMACQDNLSFMRNLKNGSMQLIVTSPPYNIGKAYESRSSLSGYVQAQAQVIAECVRLLHPRGSLCWQIGNHVQSGEIFPLDIVLCPIFREHGLKLRNRIIWHFEHGLHCSKRLSGRHETILWFTKTNDYVFNLDPIRVPSKYPGKKYFKGPKIGQPSCNPLGKNPGDVWIFPNVKNNHIEKTIHPCQFPVELVERLVLALTESGGCVLDPYMGVGSTLVAAAMHGRKGFGCDIVEKYVGIAKERIRLLQAGALKTRPMHKPVYDPKKPYGGHKVLRRNSQPTLFPIGER